MNIYASAVIASLIILCVSMAIALYRSRISRKELGRLLVRAEQAASLGRLMPSLTHDVNTNLGVCISAASYLSDTVAETSRLFEEQNLSKSSLSNHLKAEDESCKLLLLNLGKAAELIASYKKVSIDTSAPTVEPFDLDEYLKEIITSLTPRIRKTKHRVELMCAPGITLVGKPGFLYQIVTNLVSNAFVHAFDGVERGLVTIEGRTEGNEVIIKVRDDGKGMSESTQERAFTPFFTTKKREGGTGLGLSIVRSIVRDELRGSIECKSALGQGTEFTIRFPRSGLDAIPTTDEKEATT